MNNIHLMLGPGTKPIDRGQWASTRDANLIEHWDVHYTAKAPKGHEVAYSTVFMERHETGQKIELGSVMNCGREGWWAFGMTDSEKFLDRDMKGFRSRHWATVYILYVHGYITDPMRY